MWAVAVAMRRSAMVTSWTRRERARGAELRWIAASRLVEREHRISTTGRSLLPALPYFRGSASATSDVFAPAPVANTMYCFPWCRNVIGIAVVRDGIVTSPTCFPVRLSTA